MLCAGPCVQRQAQHTCWPQAGCARSAAAGWAAACWLPACPALQEAKTLRGWAASSQQWSRARAEGRAGRPCSPVLCAGRHVTVRGAVYSKMRRAVVRSKWRGMSAVRDDVVEKQEQAARRQATGAGAGGRDWPAQEQHPCARRQHSHRVAWMATKPSNVT